MQESMVRFIQDQTCATVCCTDEEGKPWCFSCFYAFDRGERLLYFKSSPATLHMNLLVNNRWLSGTILPDRLRPWATEGVQFKGEWLPADDPQAGRASEKYHLKFPLAIAVPGEVTTIRLQRVKMTSRKPGRAGKTEWVREEELKK
jgi:uncharacterized protein YhbP (UPF0306 family)